MKKTTKKLLYRFLGLLLILMGTGIFVYWVFFDGSSIIEETIVVPKQDITSGTIITKDMLTYTTREKEDIIKDAVTNMDVLINKESVCYIPANQSISPYYVEDSRLVLEDNERVFKIPNQWIVTFPQSLRRKNEIYITPVILEEIEETEKEQEQIQGDEESTDIVQAPQPTYEYVGESIITTVIYVKDSGNREVTNIADIKSKDATSKISDIEIVITEEIQQKLNQNILDGYLFEISYTSPYKGGR